MKVAFVGTGDASLDRYPPGGGIEHQVWILARELAARGHEVSILTRDGPDRGSNPRIVHVPCKGDGHVLPKLAMGRRAARWLREHPQDVVYLPEKWVSLAPSRLDAAKVYATHNKDAFATYRRLAYRDHPVNLVFFDVKRALEEREMRRAHVVAANSEGIADHLRARGMPNVELLPPAVEIDAFRAGPETEPPYLFASAQLLPVKGTHHLVEAFAAVASKHDGWRLVVGGRGPERPRLEAMARALGVAERVDFVGWQEREAYVERLGRCAAFVLPSLAETFGT
ncbi:MAG TPA: glycosyltransferase family 4 protein, partial [Candidatus Thermoplasmatota archaeon]|nr:glycosyltransferase family 4 protein [Candidatus Thermoplasmatota archaeon]